MKKILFAIIALIAFIGLVSAITPTNHEAYAAWELGLFSGQVPTVTHFNVVPVVIKNVTYYGTMAVSEPATFDTQAMLHTGIFSNKNVMPSEIVTGHEGMAESYDNFTSFFARSGSRVSLVTEKYENDTPEPVASIVVTPVYNLKDWNIPSGYEVVKMDTARGVTHHAGPMPMFTTTVPTLTDAYGLYLTLLNQSN